MYFAGSDQEWSRQLDQLETKGFYENKCGDLMLPALAHNFCVDIFVINTSRGSSLFSPISSSVWGGKQTNKPPLLLAYDRDHFETLLPATPHDCQLTIELMQRWKAGNFNVTLAGLKTRQGSHSAEQKMKPFEQVSTDRVESAASAVAMQVKNAVFILRTPTCGCPHMMTVVFKKRYKSRKSLQNIKFWTHFQKNDFL